METEESHFALVERKRAMQSFVPSQGVDLHLLRCQESLTFGHLALLWLLLCCGSAQ